MIYLQGPGHPLPAEGVTVVNTTSRSRNWSRGLSPFFLGPVDLYDEYVSRNMENAWQYSKVYRQYGDAAGPNEKYWAWAKEGWGKPWADRHPMGRQIPLYAWWDGEKLDYVAARRRIYAPLYAREVVKTEAFLQLRSLYQQEGSLILWDFDAYDHHSLGKSYQQVLDDPTRRCGHGFILAMLLENEKVWEQ